MMTDFQKAWAEATAEDERDAAAVAAMLNPCADPECERAQGGIIHGTDCYDSIMQTEIFGQEED